MKGSHSLKYLHSRDLLCQFVKGRKNEALTLDQIKELTEYTTNKLTKQKSLDLWLSSYICDGANYEDIFLFKWEDINLVRGEIAFYRRKARLTRKVEKKPILMPITERMKATIVKSYHPAKAI